MSKRRRHLEAVYNEKCWYCGQVVGSTVAIDHQIPLSKGGSDDPKNLVISCHSCNSRKGTKTVEQFRLYSALKAVSLKQFDEGQIKFLRAHFGITEEKILDAVNVVAIVFHGETNGR